MATAELTAEPVVQTAPTCAPYSIYDAAVYLTHSRGPMPYFATAVRCYLRYVPSESVHTMACDKDWRVYYSKKRTVQSQPVAFTASIIAHELLHVVLDHFKRREAVLPLPPQETWDRWQQTSDLPEEEAERRQSATDQCKRWNIAADLAVNSILSKVPCSEGDSSKSLLDAVPGYLAPDQFQLPWHKSAEWYWANLPTNDLLKQALPHIFGEGVCEFGSSAADGVARPYELPGDDGNCGAPNDKQRIVAELKIAEQISEHARRAGNVPGALQKWADDIRTRRLPWDQLWKGLCSQAGTGLTLGQSRSWAKLNRRSSPYQEMPVRKTMSPRVAFAADTSGSMDNSDTGQAAGIALDVFSRLGSGGVAVYTGDTHVQFFKKCRTAREIEFRGGGGTDMAKMLQEIADTQPRYDVVVLVTDGYTPWPSEPLGSRVVACITANGTMEGIPSWIKAVKIDSAKDE